MNTALILFGLNLAPLYLAIACVESSNGATSSNVYQIDTDGSGYVEDVNRILGISSRTLGTTFRPFVASDRLCRSASKRMMYIYWQYWGIHYEHKTGKPVSYEVLARIHNGGPLGWKKPATDRYWRRVKSILENQGVKL